MRFWVFLLAVALAGCASTGTMDSTTPDTGATTTTAPPSTSTTTSTPPAPLNATTQNATLLPGNGTVNAATWTLAGLGYDSELVTYSLTARENVTVAFAAKLDVSTYAPDVACVVLAAQGPEPGFGLGVIVWMFENDVQGEVRAGGTGAGSPGFGDQFGGSVAGEPTFRTSLAAGQAITIYLGGTHPEYLAAERTGTGAQVAEARLEWTGQAELKQEASRPIVCGLGPRGTTGETALVRAGYTVSQVGGEAELATTHGSLLIWEWPGSALERDAIRVSLSFLGENLDATTSHRRSTPDAGTIAVNVDQWSTALPGTAWLLADADWPFMLSSD